MGNVSHCKADCRPCEEVCEIPGRQGLKSLVSSFAISLQDESDSDAGSTNPAGAIFEETLLEMGELERNLLFFSAGFSVVAVRWVLLLGADKHTCDLNGTNALHAACRKGSLPVVTELVKQNVGLETTDFRRWTPLHVAVFVGRWEVVEFLLGARAPVFVRNVEEQTPFDLCSDPRTEEVIASYVMHLRTRSTEPWRFKLATDAQRRRQSAMYEPSLPQQSPAFVDVEHRKEFFNLAMAIFNVQQGPGLAFLVACGCIRGVPSEVCMALKCELLDLSQIGCFLGEPFSLSKMLCLELLNSVALLGTGVLSALSTCLSLMQLPPDLQKIDRLVAAVAQIWWRQHLLLEKKERRSKRQGRDESMGGWRGEDPSTPDPELFGDGPAITSSHLLRKHVVSPQALSQLMFSVVMLHRNVYHQEDGSTSDFGLLPERRLSVDAWVDVNGGLLPDGGDLPRALLEELHSAVTAGFIPQLAIGDRPASPVQRAGSSFMQKFVHAEGWVLMNSFKHDIALAKGAPSLEDVEFSDLFSESMSYSARPPTLDSSRYSCGRTAKTGELRRWMSVCHTVMFFSKSCSPDEVPYAFIYLPNIAIEKDKHDPAHITFSPPEPEDVSDALHISVVFLLQDGRWQELRLPRLDLRVESLEGLDTIHKAFDLKTDKSEYVCI